PSGAVRRVSAPRVAGIAALPGRERPRAGGRRGRPPCRARGWGSAPDARASRRSDAGGPNSYRGALERSVCATHGDALDPVVWGRPDVLRDLSVDPVDPRDARSVGGSEQRVLLPVNARPGAGLLQRGVARGTSRPEADARG